MTVVLNAQRAELFVGRYRFAGDQLVTCEELQETTLVSMENWLAGLTSGEVVTGPGLAECRDRLPATVEVADQRDWQPQAARVAESGWDAFRSSSNLDQFNPFALLPQYFRRTAAEEQWEKRASKARQT